MEASTEHTKQQEQRTNQYKQTMFQIGLIKTLERKDNQRELIVSSPLMRFTNIK